MLLVLILACGERVDQKGEEITAGTYEGDEAGECSDGADNDQDGLFDCDDDGCLGSPDCNGDDPDNPTDTGDTDDTSNSDSGDTDQAAACNPGAGELIGAGNLSVQIAGSTLDDSQNPAIPDLAGWSVAVCDLDNDGFDDLAVGVPFSAGGAGRIALYYGPGNNWTSFMDTTGNSADAYIFADGAQGYLGTSLACSDINGDGADDLVIAAGQGSVFGNTVQSGVRAFYNTGTRLTGQVPLLAADVALFHDTGYTGSIAHFPLLWNADLDGDGMDEVVFFMNRNSYYDPNSSADNTDNKLWVLNLDDNESGAMEDVVSYKITPDQLDSVTQVSEYGSGIFIGQGFEHANGLVPGRANFVSGTIDSDISLSTNSAATVMGAASMEFGTSAVFADFDQDGQEDAVFGAPGDGGALYYFSGSTSGFSGEMSVANADNSFTTSYGYKGVGWRMRSIGDFDGDGHPDLLASALGDGDDRGKVFVVSGACIDDASTTLNTATLLTISGETPGDWFGRSIATGDINGDGSPDLVIGAPYQASPAGVDNGKVYVYLSE